MRFLKPWLQIALEWLHECCMLCVVGRKPEHETLWFFPTLTCGVFVFSSASAASPVRPPALTLSLTHSHLLSLTHSPTHSLTHTHSLGLRLRLSPPLCVAGVGQCALSRGRMYAPGFRWRPWVSASFAWQAWDNVHCQGVFPHIDVWGFCF